MNQGQTSPSVASPVATGGGGVFFEQHVGASFLSLLLVRGVPPCLPSCQLMEVHLQTAHNGWLTDDLLLVGKRADGQTMRLACQVKRKIIVSRTDADFRDTILNSWRDFQTKNPFNPRTDAFAIIALRGSEALLNHFVALLDCARFCRDAEDFSQRLATPGFLNKIAIRYCRYLSNIGEASLPDAFVRISKKLLEPRECDLLLTSTAQFYIEAILRRWILTQAGKLKEKVMLRDAILHILDELVEAGSSVAYRLRDDFVTPDS